MYAAHTAVFRVPRHPQLRGRGLAAEIATGRKGAEIKILK